MTPSPDLSSSRIMIIDDLEANVAVLTATTRAIGYPQAIELGADGAPPGADELMVHRELERAASTRASNHRGFGRCAGRLGHGGRVGTIITVMIVDDHRLLADGVARSLELNDNIEVVGIADDIASGRRLASDERPDVALLDYSLPSGDGIELAIELRAAYPGIRLVMLTAQTDPSLISRAVHANMDGFVCKTATTQELIDAVVSVSTGGAAFRQSDLKAVLDHANASTANAGRGLSKRELQVLQQIATGRSTAEVSSLLFVSPNTIRTHVRSILMKFDAHSKLEAVAIAIREGVIDPGRAET